MPRDWNLCVSWFKCLHVWVCVVWLILGSFMVLWAGEHFWCRFGVPRAPNLRPRGQFWLPKTSKFMPWGHFGAPNGSKSKPGSWGLFGCSWEHFGGISGPFCDLLRGWKASSKRFIGKVKDNQKQRNVLQNRGSGAWKIVDK